MLIHRSNAYSWVGIHLFFNGLLRGRINEVDCQQTTVNGLQTFHPDGNQDFCLLTVGRRPKNAVFIMQVSLFNGFADKNPKPITIREVVEIIRADQRLQVLTDNHRRYRTAGDTARADAEKQHMPCYSVAVLFSGGKQQKHIVSYTGLSIVDLDHIAPEDMARVLTAVRNDPHTLLAYTTISGEGVRVITRYALNDDENDNVGDNENLRAGVMLSNVNLQVAGPKGKSKHLAQCNEDKSLSENNCEILREAQDDKHNVKQCAEQYKISFVAINEYYKRLTGCDYDEKCKNATRLSGMAHDPEVYYNPDAVPIVVDMAKKPVGRPKRVERLKMTVERCEAAVLRELARRGVVYEAGTYNKYVSAACYEMNRYGVPEEQCREWAVNRFADYDAAEVTSIVRSCYLQTEEHGIARPPKAEKESRYASIKDIQEWLTENNIRIRHNVITRKREISFNDNDKINDNVNDNCYPLRTTCSSPLKRDSAESTEYSANQNELSPFKGDERREQSERSGGGQEKSSSSSSFSLIWKELEDKSVNSLYCRFCLDTGRQAKISDFYIIIESDFYPDYHPLKEYLEGLPAWDGMTDHIDRLASTVHVTGCTQELHNRFFKKWMVAMVAAWLDDGTTNHEILTYIGEQGKYKTSFMTHLLPPALDKYFAIKHFNHSMSKDDRLALTELALIDLEELDNLRPEAVNLLKAITTDPAINLRPVWERYALRRQHIASFCGTGNNPRFLTDLSGNRRWLPFMVESIDSPWERATDYDGIYAQAYALWQQGFRYWFDDAENAELEQHNRQFEEPNIEEELILTYLRQPYGDEAGEFLTATRIIELIGMYVKCPLSPKRVAFAMNRLGYRQRRVGGVRGYNVIILTGNDIKEQQRLNARESTINE